MESVHAWKAQLLYLAATSHYHTILYNPAWWDLISRVHIAHIHVTCLEHPSTYKEETGI